MNPKRKQRRIRISWLAVWLLRVRRFCCSWLLFRPLWIVGNLMLAFAKKKSHHRVEILKRNVASWAARTEAFCADCRAVSLPGDRPAENRRQDLLVRQAALFAERDNLLATVVGLQSPHTIRGSPAVLYMLMSVQRRIFRIQSKNEALKGLLSQLESPTYYWDLLLWFVIPGSYSEELMGDLAEEYHLRNATEGEAVAKAWYRGQVMDCLWKRIERIVAIATLIDFANRLFRN
jgi:hypothetical protein